MLIEINPLNPDSRAINSVVEKMKNGAVIIYPTDSVYALGCDPESKKGVEKLYQLKNSDPSKSPLTFICDTISMASAYSSQISNSNFRFIKDHTPGPFTFILPASNNLPKILHVKNKTYGFRIPDHRIPQELIKALGRPILSASLKSIERKTRISSICIRKIFIPIIHCWWTLLSTEVRVLWSKVRWWILPMVLRL